MHSYVDFAENHEKNRNFSWFHQSLSSLIGVLSIRNEYTFTLEILNSFRGFIGLSGGIFYVSLAENHKNSIFLWFQQPLSS